jgi:ubiquinone biosynthesis monooxygenase Coq7
MQRIIGTRGLFVVQRQHGIKRTTPYWCTKGFVPHQAAAKAQWPKAPTDLSTAAPAKTTMDALVRAADATLRTLFAHPKAARARPAPHTDANEPQPDSLSEADRKLSGALMRVNHVGEVCAQALYTAQAMAARLKARPADEALAARLEAAGREETDHLAWTRDRLDELGAHPSWLNPLWYAGAFGLGLVAGQMGKRISLGFVVETERQVEAHLASHMDRLPTADLASRAIVAQMKDDEAQHAREAKRAGGTDLPRPVQHAMSLAAKVMTTVAHRV